MSTGEIVTDGVTPLPAGSDVAPFETGRVVTILVDRIMFFGNHAVQWDTRNQTGHKVCSGIYYYQLVTDKSKITKKMVLIH